MNKDDIQNDPDYADFVTPTYDCYEDDEISPYKMPDIDDIKKEHDADTYMINMLELMLGSPLGMRSDLVRLSGTNVSWMAP
jgi:hypothetical protein